MEGSNHVRRARWLAGTFGDDAPVEFNVTLLSDADWSPTLGETAFALTRIQCGNTVDSEGTATHVDGDLHQCCRPSCGAGLEGKYERLQQRAD